MSSEIHKPLLWHQGLFLQPQHFQLQDAYQRSQLVSIQQLVSPHFWGVKNIEVKKSALGGKSFGLLQGQFLFPDGTYIEFPGNAILEDRSFDDAWKESGKPFTVYLGLKRWDDNSENVSVLKTDESSSRVTTRYVSELNPEEVKDLHTGGPTGHVKRMNHVLKFFWESEVDNLGSYMLIPLAQVERQGTGIGLVSNFIPPCVALSGSLYLRQIVKEISDQLLSRSRQLEEHKTQRGLQTAEFGSRDMVYLLALRSINRYLPWLLHYSEVESIHPWHVYGILRQIVGDLSCFSGSISVLGENTGNGAHPLSVYNHLNIYDCFSQAQKLIGIMLNEITAGPEHIVNMGLSDGIYSTELKPSINDGKRFYLAVTTESDPQKVIGEMVSVAKLSSKSHLGLLVSHALPGIPLEYLSVPPQELPRRNGVLYFSINIHSDQWSYVKREKSLALSWDGAPEGLKVDLMVTTR